MLATVAVTVAGVIFNISKTEWLFIAVCCAAVIATEMINTAIEKLCDMVSTEIHPVIKIIKDVSAGAVLVCAIGSVVVGSIIFLPKIIELI